MSSLFVESSLIWVCSGFGQELLAKAKADQKKQAEAKAKAKGAAKAAAAKAAATAAASAAACEALVALSGDSAADECADAADECAEPASKRSKRGEASDGRLCQLRNRSSKEPAASYQSSQGSLHYTTLHTAAATYY